MAPGRGAIPLALAFAAACANTGEPPGGPPDEKPPVILGVYPESGAVVPNPRGDAVIQFDGVIDEQSGGGGGRRLGRRCRPRLTHPALPHRGPGERLVAPLRHPCEAEGRVEAGARLSAPDPPRHRRPAPQRHEGAAHDRLQHGPHDPARPPRRHRRAVGGAAGARGRTDPGAAPARHPGLPRPRRFRRRVRARQPPARALRRVRDRRPEQQPGARPPRGVRLGAGHDRLERHRRALDLRARHRRPEAAPGRPGRLGHGAAHVHATARSRPAAGITAGAGRGAPRLDAGPGARAVHGGAVRLARDARSAPRSTRPAPPTTPRARRRLLPTRSAPGRRRRGGRPQPRRARHIGAAA